jgi:hypothetical protein
MSRFAGTDRTYLGYDAASIIHLALADGGSPGRRRVQAPDGTDRSYDWGGIVSANTATTLHTFSPSFVVLNGIV